MKINVNNKIIVVIVILLILFSMKLFVFNNKEEVRSKNLISNNSNIELNEYVKTEDKVDLYVFQDNEYIKSGYVSKDVILHISKKDNDYYSLDDLDDYYVKSDKLSNYEKEVVINDRYKNYIVFNSNINTYDKTEFYDENNNLIYSVNKSLSLPIIIKDNDKYGVEFANRLLYIKDSDGKVEDSNNTKEHNISGVATLNYHSFYSDNNEQEKKSCNSSICHSDKQFREQLEYIKDNNILTLKMDEMEKYIDGKIQLPKSVLITIDDGGLTKVAVDILSEYKMYATIFLITSWYNPSDYYVTDYIELHSHSHDMHKPGVCPKGQGGAIQCLSEEEIQKDLKTSRELLNNTTYFCYPFYEYNDYSIEQLKKAGFTMSFVGESTKSDNLAKVGMDKFRIPRFVIVDYTTIDDLKKYFDRMK